MKLLRLNTLTSIKKIYKYGIVSIGDFDGMHKGHQQIINKMLNIAKKNKLYYTAIICFEPLSKEFFCKNTFYRIMSLRDKIITCKNYNIDKMICCKFNKSFAHYSGKVFIKKILIDILNTKHIVISKNFHIGFKRDVDINELIFYSKMYEFNIHNIKCMYQEQVPISSSKIRTLLKDNHLSQIPKYLGRHYSLYGKIHRGNKIGRTICFPTANIPIYINIPLSGVYIVKIYWKNTVYFGVANIGLRPTVNIYKTKTLLEINIFNFNYNIYNQYIKVTFLKYIRNEINFKNIETLKIQISKDKIIACKWIMKYFNIKIN